MEITLVEGEPISIDMLSEDALDESNLRQQFGVKYLTKPILSKPYYFFLLICFFTVFISIYPGSCLDIIVFLYIQTTIMIFSK